MPTAAYKPCNYPGCAALLPVSGYCAEHSGAVRRMNLDQRPSANERGYGAAWQRARADFLKSHPLCSRCQANGRIVSATVVDHIIPHKGDDRLFWDSENNWQPLCQRCHNEKTATEDGGFGRGREGEFSGARRR